MLSDARPTRPRRAVRPERTVAAMSTAQLSAGFRMPQRSTRISRFPRFPRCPRFLRGPRAVTVVACALFGSALVLSGCAGLAGAPASVALSEVSGFAADAPINEPIFDNQWSGEPVGWLAENRETLTVVSYWSSSCPLIATAIEEVDDTLLSIELQPPPLQACTEDLAPRTHVIAVPDGWGLGAGPYSAQVTRLSDARDPIIAATSTIVLWPIETEQETEQEAPVGDSIAIETVRGLPDGITLTDDALTTGEPLAYWGDGRATLLVVTWGSSSCPPPATSLVARSDTELALIFGALPPIACTADFGPTTHVLTTPEGVRPGEATLAITVELRDAASLEYRIPITD